MKTSGFLSSGNFETLLVCLDLQYKYFLELSHLPLHHSKEITSSTLTDPHIPTQETFLKSPRRTHTTFFTHETIFPDPASTMSSYRTVTCLPRAVYRPANLSAVPVRAMTSFFPRFPSSDFAPFFRLLDAADPFVLPRSQSRSFVPRFDVREVGSSYELHGELPGIKQEDIDIEFVDANTLVIRGKTESHNSSSNQETKPLEQPAASEPVTDDNASEKSASSYQKPSVEDDYVDAGEAAKSSEGPATSTTATAQAASAPESSTTRTSAEPDYKYWVSERSVGEFSRRFEFPGRVDQESVKASLKNGILSVIVPKAVRAEKKITIE